MGRAVKRKRNRSSLIEDIVSECISTIHDVDIENIDDVYIGENIDDVNIGENDTKSECAYSVAITDDMPISNFGISKGVLYSLTVPRNKLSNEEEQMWLKFAMALYDPNIESDKIIDPKTKGFTPIGSLYYALKFALAGKGGRFKEYLKIKM